MNFSYKTIRKRTKVEDRRYRIEENFQKLTFFLYSQLLIKNIFVLLFFCFVFSGCRSYKEEMNSNKSSTHARCDIKERKRGKERDK